MGLKPPFQPRFCLPPIWSVSAGELALGAMDGSVMENRITMDDLGVPPF
jgi:hypothetical protein